MERKPSDKAKISLPSDTEILIERDFKARKDNLFLAWVKRDWVEQWYGCDAQQLVAFDIDFREGGAWRWVLKSNDGGEHAFSGVYKLIDRPNRLVFSECYEVIPGSDHTVELGFDERGGVTTLSMRIIHKSKEVRDGHLKSGMQTGIQVMFDIIEELAGGSSAQAQAASG